MAQYVYRAMDAAGELIPGSMEAANVPDLEARLHRMQLDLIDCKIDARFSPNRFFHTLPSFLYRLFVWSRV